MKPTTKTLSCFISTADNCSYLPTQTTQLAFLDPSIETDTALYSDLTRQGFRRSGQQIYKPHCPNCQACIPLRIPLQSFTPNRNQRRIWQRNQDVNVTTVAPDFNPEHFMLYQRYLNIRHSDSSMASTSEEDYLSFLTCPGIKTAFIEFRLDGKLFAIAVTDILKNELSAVYSFFDPDYAHRSPGVFAILWQIEHGKHLQLNHLYLGYWIESCAKMSYKNQYQPCETFSSAGWNPLNKP